MNKQSIAVIAAAVIIGVGTFGVSSVFAQDTTNAHPMDSLVQKIASKFNLKQNDVQAVFDEVRTERQKVMQTANEERLSQLVKEGKITEAQKQLLLQKHTEMQGKMGERMRNLSPDEKQSQRNAKRAEMETWAKENNIDVQYLMPQGEKGKGFGHQRIGEYSNSYSNQ